MLDQALDVVDDFDPAIVVVSLGLDTFGGDPICDLALTTDGFRRCGAAVAARGRPLVVLQEGGYAGEALGANVVAWLTGADLPSRSECFRPSECHAARACQTLRRPEHSDQRAWIAAITAAQRSGSLR